jgi:hypothetical protein
MELQLLTENTVNFENKISKEEDVLRQRKLDILHQEGHVKEASKIYGHVKTDDILKIFVENGFSYTLEDMKIKGGRKHSSDFKAHLVILSHPRLERLASGLDVREGVPRIYLWNSYDRSKSLQFDIGFFRGFCWNSMVFGDKVAKTIKIVHKRSESNIEVYRKKIEQAVETMMKAFDDKVQPFIESLMETKMSQKDQMEFAKKAFEMRVGHKNFISGDYETILRNLGDINADEGNSCWQVLNRVQRNLGLNFRKEEYQSDIKYKYYGTDKEGNQTVKERSIAILNEPIRVTDLNKQLMDLITNYLPEETQNMFNQEEQEELLAVA